MLMKSCQLYISLYKNGRDLLDMQYVRQVQTYNFEIRSDPELDPIFFSGSGSEKKFRILIPTFQLLNVET